MECRSRTEIVFMGHKRRHTSPGKWTLYFWEQEWLENITQQQWGKKDTPENFTCYSTAWTRIPRQTSQKGVFRELYHKWWWSFWLSYRQPFILRTCQWPESS